MNLIIKDYRVNTLPVVGIPNSRYYVPNGQGSDIDEYVTDLNGNFRKVNPIVNISAGSSLIIRCILN